MKFINWINGIFRLAENSRQQHCLPETSGKESSNKLDSAQSKNDAEMRKNIDSESNRHSITDVNDQSHIITSGDNYQQRNARSKVLHHILSLIQDSEFSDHLILRGSVLLRSWIGEQARHPDDLDWIVTPHTWQYNEVRSRFLRENIVELIRGTRVTDEIQIPDRQFLSDDIFSYEKAPGWYVCIPWVGVNPTQEGYVIMDFVFGEYVPSRPVSTEVMIDDLPVISIRTASSAQSLAWKLLWLATDDDEMGKDLYDAVLLAESTAISIELLLSTFKRTENENYTLLQKFNAETIRSWNVEWEEFIEDYPHVTGTDVEWKERLVTALKPLMRELESLDNGSA